jgi:hypothetical protein
VKAKDVTRCLEGNAFFYSDAIVPSDSSEPEKPKTHKSPKRKPDGPGSLL